MTNLEESVKETTVVIIGGGATGTGILRDLAMRGVRALLFEMGSVANGTSSRFHGLLHSGARYAVSDNEAAAECIRENIILKRIGKSCVQNTGGFFVLTEKDDPSYVEKWVEGCRRAGIDAVEIDPAEAKRMEPDLAPDVKRVFRVPDGTIDGFRLVQQNVMSARRYGSEALTYHAVTGITTFNGRVTGVDVLDRATGEKYHVACSIVINAAGSWSGQVARLVGLDIPVTPDKGSLIIFNQRFAGRVINRLHKSSDGDIFVPHGSITILGTTSTSVKDPAESKPTTAEILHLLDCGRPLIANLDSFRILRAFAGTRPLYTPGGAQGRAASRGFHISDHAEEGVDGMVTIFGGKFTTFRLMAEKVCDLVCRKLGVTAACRTADEPIVMPPSPETRARARKCFMPQTVGLVADRLGDDFADLVEKASGSTRPNPLLCECEMVSFKEIAYQAAKPSTHSLNDIRLATRMGMGTCQGTFCALRAAGCLCENGLSTSLSGGPLGDIAAFVQERWKGVRPVYWGQLAREMEMTRMVHCANLALDSSLDDAARTEVEGSFSPDFRLPEAVMPEASSFARRGNARSTQKADTIVVGGGLAGLTAALVAARQGQKVTLISRGAGALAISTSAIDVLGRTTKGLVSGSTLSHIDELPDGHPYRLLGADRLLEAFGFLSRLAAVDGWKYRDFGLNSDNTFVPSFIGTLKATGFVPRSMDAASAGKAKRILVCGVDGVRDCMPSLPAEVFATRPQFEGVEFSSAILDSPVHSGYRALTALDVARACDGSGFEVLLADLARKARGYDAVFLPPVLGTLPGDEKWVRACDAAGCPVVEMAAIPPGVTGMRLGHLFNEALRREGVTCVENTLIKGCEMENGRMTAVLSSNTDGVRRFEADRFIVATGGLTGGGLTLEPGKCTEDVLGLTLSVPAETTEWTAPSVFGWQPFACLGVPVTKDLLPGAGGSPFASNVRFAGRIVGGFDPVFEKSGNGVALATGYWAAAAPWGEN